MTEIEIFQEHGGALYAKFDRAEATFFGHQIALSDNEIKLYPTVIRFKPTQEEIQLFRQFAKPITKSILANRSKSAITDIEFSDFAPEEKKELLKSLRSEINELLRKI